MIDDKCLSFDKTEGRGEFETKIGVKKVIQGRSIKPRTIYREDMY